LLSGANIQTKNETRAKRCQILSLFNTFGAMTKNERFKKALDWLYSEGMIVDQQELSSKTGINEATISRILNNKVRQPSPETIRKLVSVFRDIDPAFLRGESESVIVQQSQTYVEPSTHASSPIDPSSILNAALAAQMQTIESLKSEKATLLEVHARELKAKDDLIQSLREQLATKDQLIAEQKARLVDYRRLIDSHEIENSYPFPVGVADGSTSQKRA
jgi:transcriptional regulator with XRE-family HTH domain